LSIAVLSEEASDRIPTRSFASASVLSILDKREKNWSLDFYLFSV
jgi:hypothetical protein